MAETIGYDDVVRMLRGGADAVSREHEALSRLDAATGDGDHGTTIRRAMGLLEKAVDDAAPGDLAGLLRGVGWAIMGVDGGATGPLVGSFFMGMSGAAGGRESLDAASVAALFEAGLAMVRKQTKAQVGDKTVIDALVPGVEALREAADDGKLPADAMVCAAEAAERGAAGTKDLQAKFGRARNLGERSVGSQDPGATSMSLMLRGFAQALSASGT